MFQKITFGKYIKKESKIHDLNPVIKLLCSIIFIISLYISDNIILHVILSILCLIMMLESKINLKTYIYNLRMIRYLILVLIIINTIFGVSILTTFILTLNLCLTVLYSSILNYTTRHTEIAYAISKLISPLKIFKINTEEIAFTISTSIRFIPIIIKDVRDVFKSSSIRGISYESSTITEKINITSRLIIPIFVNSLDKVDDYATNLELRFYGGQENRTNIYIESPTMLDYKYLFLHLLIIFSYMLVSL